MTRSSGAPAGSAIPSPPESPGESWGRDTARRMLGATSTRFAHTARVASQAGTVRHLLADPWRSALVEAAWLHDVGYSPQIASAGFHPLDGARWLQAQGRSPEVCRLVAWHTRAHTEARLRGLGDALEAEFAAPPAPAQAALTWADLTSSPTGDRWAAETRITDILSRYGPDSVVHRATLANEVELLDDVRSVARKISSPARQVP